MVFNGAPMLSLLLFAILCVCKRALWAFRVAVSFEMLPTGESCIGSPNNGGSFPHMLHALVLLFSITMSTAAPSVRKIVCDQLSSSCLNFAHRQRTNSSGVRCAYSARTTSAAPNCGELRAVELPSTFRRAPCCAGGSRNLSPAMVSRHTRGCRRPFVRDAIDSEKTLTRRLRWRR